MDTADLTSYFCRQDTYGPEGSFVFVDPAFTVSAHKIEDVSPSIRLLTDRCKTQKLIACGFVSYEAAPAFYDRMQVNNSDTNLPLIWFTAYRDIAAIDAPKYCKLDNKFRWRSEFNKKQYIDAVDHIHKRLDAGDTYQVNLTQRIKSKFTGDTQQLYQNMSLTQRGRYSTFIDTPEFSVLCASPESFFTISSGRITSIPMKGTAKRGMFLTDDLHMAKSLRNDEKEISENLMIVDLIRNDLGQLCKFGSIKGTKLFDIERYPNLWQMTSSIEGVLEGSTEMIDIFGALFPCGSVTGVPKISTMKIISEYEQSPRGIYCGAIGTIDYRSGELRADFGVAIRTATYLKADKTLIYGTGGGITVLSDPHSEWNEMRLKTSPIKNHTEPRALLETMLFNPFIGIKNMERHILRISESMEYFGFDGCFDLKEELLNACRFITVQSRIRLIVDKYSGVSISATPFIDNIPTPVTLGFADYPVNSNRIGLYHKFADRSFYTKLKSTKPECYDVILFNERNEITETTTANIAFKIGDQWMTPPTKSGILRGIEREILLESGVIVEAVIDKSQLTSLTPTAIFNSLRGLKPAKITC